VPTIQGNPVQLQQVIMNLMMNAIESMHAADPRQLRITSRLSKPGLLCVSIEDTGSGIDPSKFDQIFQPLFTTKTRGMGIGLSICRSVIERHGGRIWVSPAPTRGSIFQFELPVAAHAERLA
jgi:signal transduction histidine kinase